MNGKPYEIKVATGKGIRIYSVRAFSVNDAIHIIAHHKLYEYIFSVSETTWERFHALELAEVIADADTWDKCKNECGELCRIAGMESEWREADGDTFESVLNEAAKKLNVNI